MYTQNISVFAAEEVYYFLFDPKQGVLYNVYTNADGRRVCVMRNVVELKALMEKANDYWIAENPNVGNNAWERAAYFLGNGFVLYPPHMPQRYLNYRTLYNHIKTSAVSDFRYRPL